MNIGKELMERLNLPKSTRKISIVFEVDEPTLLTIEFYKIDNKLTPILELATYELTEKK
jgi:hypothetical protein